jgi:hypothetical protein
VKVREVDLTVGRVDPVSENVGAFAAPFAQGPVDQAVLIETEDELLKVFGKPYVESDQNVHWFTASSYLSYGGILRVVRADSSDLTNANAGVAATSTSGNLVGTSLTNLKIKSIEDYRDNFDDGSETDWAFASVNPGSWANSLRVCVIDNFADQTLSVGSTAGYAVGYGVTQAVSYTVAGAGSTSVFTGYLKGIITKVNPTSVDVKVTSVVSSAGTETAATYQKNGNQRFVTTSNVYVVNNSGVGIATTTPSLVEDWYDNQTLGLTNKTIYWKNVAPKPGTSQWALDRSASDDEINVVVVDDDGTISREVGGILEVYTGLSKALDARKTPGTPIYYRDYIAERSSYIFAGAGVGPVEISSVTGFSTGFTPYTESGNVWNQNAQGVKFNVVGALSFDLQNGKNYDGTTTLGANSFNITLAELVSAYDKYETPCEYDINFLIAGPALATKEDSQALASKLIQIADLRKDCIACISPYKDAVVNAVADVDQQTDAVISFFDALNSSSYAVFDSGWKYMFDRFNDKFIYVPCNGDVAGTMARTSINSFPWFSPAGAQRGTINFAIKLAYNPGQTQRDLLYPKRINPIIFSPGQGFILFGDKTALGYPSAFDRINVRRLFLTIEKAISKTSRDFLFEINDELTRNNFINIVTPYLRDVQAKRGITDFLVVCNETNNTPDVIDANEFKADFYIQPSRSINFIGLTFVATRTGISFEEVVGRV